MALRIDNMDSCPFCIENGLLRSEVMYDGSLWYFVLNTDDTVQHGGMAITKRHIETPFDINTEEWANLHELLPKFKELISEETPHGYNLGWNVYPTGGQTVAHAHLHLVARFDDEPLAGKGIRYALKDESNKRPSK